MGNNSNRVWLTVIISLLVLILLVGGTYAWFTLTLKGKNNNIIKAGTLSLVLDESQSVAISLNNTVPMTDLQGLDTVAYTFKLKNNGTINSDYTIYLDDIELESGESRMSDKYVKYSLTKDSNPAITAVLPTIGTNPNRILDNGVIEKDTTYTYTLRLWIDKDADNAVMNTTFKARLRVEAVQQNIVRNSNIVSVYNYNEVSTASDYCITGEEQTCVEINPYTYKVGTIVKYRVNDTDEKYFYVMKDNGDTLTMQQRENTVSYTPWISVTDYTTANTDGTSCSYPSCNDEGPITVLTALESATNGWTNVKDQTYTMGTTVFETNAYTGCSAITCTTNVYTLAPRTAKARMITIQEAVTLGCTNTEKTCPIWMNNYLYNSTNYGGTVDDNQIDPATSSNNLGYWTMSGSSSNVYSIGRIYYNRNISGGYAHHPGYGARAVVEIAK